MKRPIYQWLTEFWTWWIVVCAIAAFALLFHAWRVA